MMNFDDLTLIIPPHNRYYHLKRTIEYLSRYNGKVIISDSSDVPFDGMDALPSNYKYIHCPGYSFTKKMNDALQLVETKYVMFYAEDDFYSVNGILTCLQFLRTHESYASCQGNYKKFWLDEGIEIKDTYSISLKKDINQVNANDRLLFFIKEYFQLFYAIHTASYMQELFSQFNTYGIKNMFAVEIAIAIRALIAGKHKVLNKYYGLREVIATSVGHHKDNYNAFIKSDKFLTERNNFYSYFKSFDIDLDLLNETYFNQVWNNRNALDRFKLRFRFLCNKIVFDDSHKSEDDFRLALTLINKYKNQINL